MSPNPLQSDSAVSWYLAAPPASIRRWVARVRWTTAAIETLVVAVAFFASAGSFPLRSIAPLMAAAALTNGELASRIGRGDAVPIWLRGASLLLDVALLTMLLELSGGPSNPFAVVYAVFVMLAAVTLGARAAYAVGAAAAGSYGVLTFWHYRELAVAHHRFVDFPMHLFTMWLALAALGEVVALIASAASAAVARREEEVAELRREAARKDHMVSLTTLAAGAAHELSTPLATIAVAARELERTLTSSLRFDECTDDARLIRREVDRCQMILDQMSGRAGGAAAELPQSCDSRDLVADIVARLQPEQASRLIASVEPGLPAILIPRVGLVQALHSLVRNAFDATDAMRPVTLTVSAAHHVVRFTVRDEGHGMLAETLRRAGEPFFTTKEPGRGTGLGLFLARSFAERCGGALRLQSGSGTTAVLEVPVAAPRVEVA